MFALAREHFAQADVWAKAVGEPVTPERPSVRQTTTIPTSYDASSLNYAMTMPNEVELKHPQAVPQEDEIYQTASHQLNERIRIWKIETEKQLGVSPSLMTSLHLRCFKFNDKKITFPDFPLPTAFQEW